MTKRQAKAESGVVYSTEHGRMCPACGQQSTKCKCTTRKPTTKTDGIVRISRETKGRKGKGVTLISGINLDSASLEKLAKQLKQKCGSGGTIKNQVIEIQGDHRETLFTELDRQGFKVKHSGG